MSDPRSDHPVDLLSAYLDDELSLEDRGRVDRHLAACASCRDDLDALHLLAAAVAKEGTPPVPGDLIGKIGAAVDKAQVLPIRPRRRWVAPVSIAATVAAVGLLVAFQWRQGTLAPASSPPARALAKRDAGLQRAEPPPVRSAPPKVSADQKAEAQAPAGAPAGEASAPALENKESTNAPADELDAAKGKDVPARKKSVGYVGELSPTPPPPPQLPRPAEGGAFRERRDADRVMAPAAAIAKGAVANCLESWIDAGRVGEWTISDTQAALKELGGIADALGGRGVFRPSVNAQSYEIYLAVARYPDLVTALRARGVTGLDAPVTPFEGTDCVRQRVVLTLGEPPSKPR